jgi:alpha-ketoglutarate-dependent taurine dioxygenase
MSNAATSRVSADNYGLGDAVTLTPHGSERLPVFLTPLHHALESSLDQSVAWLRKNDEAIKRLLREAGALVLRGFPIRSTGDFARMVEHFPSPAHGYVAGAGQRNNIEGRIFEATHAAAHLKLPLHQEMSYLRDYPSKLAFFCRIPPDTGGETWVGDMRRATRMISRDFMNKVRERGVLYTRNYRAPGSEAEHILLEQHHRTWSEAFSTKDRAKVEEACGETGLEFEWLQDGGLTVRYRASGFAKHPVSGEDVWFNQLHNQNTLARNLGPQRHELYEKYYPPGRPRPLNATFGDGGAFDPADIDMLFSIFSEISIAFPWRVGDMMLVDNIYTAHGRNSYTGNRDVQVSLIT